MNEKLFIKNAIVSVSDKKNLEKLIPFFLKYKINIFSTGGSFKYLKSVNSGIKLYEISKLTGFNEILDGRVKTLHPAIHSGILARKNKSRDKKEIKDNGLIFFDLVIVNLYPFEETINNTKNKFEKCIENIDIGGSTMIRAAAKNFENVVILSDPAQYEQFVNNYKKKNGLSLEMRKKLAIDAFKTSSFYEATISNWFLENSDQDIFSSSSLYLKKIKQLRYGENPHQKSSLFKWGKNPFVQISGKELSYNNIVDIENCISLVIELRKKQSCVILKHANPCGVSINKEQKDAYIDALRCDPISAFGGVIAFNSEVLLETAQEILKNFVEVIIAPSFTQQAKNLLIKSKKNLILVISDFKLANPKYTIKTTNNYLLIQSKDSKILKKDDLIFKTSQEIPIRQLNDLIFANSVAKYVTSNAIVLAKNQSTLGIGVGQTNRIASAKIAIHNLLTNFDNQKDVVLASDGFFPFPDIIQLCVKHNISSIIQPGGSINDKKVILEAKKNKINLVFSGVRHFKH
ncbi:MAG: bifunctional phosphoribosylaminoimidazolecarboxamide formyltransferase/IMP cyclohydrolase PurH [Rickettsiales bacterium]|nr:bifunctional phosphoribosylaminoimidazolecarboxamide formyltransferase/IMP cyclohydrolase PurH [Rickettsiales bacterium]OUV54816.1 MAG: bifunctional phosphoribosylaminoimidazolecarboxamide formyltransferase/IMP cyclohydrolase [Rickettsiales bacterium TMED127]